MGIVIFVGIFLFLALAGSIAYGIYSAVQADKARVGDHYTNTPGNPDAKGAKWPWFAAIPLFIGLLISLGVVEIGPGYVGVVTNLGVVQDDELPPGVHFVFPIVNSVTEFDTRVRALRVENYSAASLEQQDLFLNMTLNYHVIPTEASVIVKTIGTDFEAKIVMPRLLDIPKSVTDDYPTRTVLNSRDEIRAKSVELLSSALAPYGLVVDTINLENFSYSEAYNESIEQKQIEQQKVQTEQQKLEQERIRAEQVVVAAQGAANARIEEARGEAEANRLLAESISPILIQWEAIQKLQDNIEIMLVPSDGGFIFDLSGLQPTQP